MPDGNMKETPAAPQFMPTQPTSWCLVSSARLCPSQEACTPCRWRAADRALPTTSGPIPTHCPRTPCTITPTSTPPLTNTTSELRPGLRLTLYRASGDTRTITTWIPPQLTCTRQPAARLTTTTDPDNDCCPSRIMTQSTVGKLGGQEQQHGSFRRWFLQHVGFNQRLRLPSAG